MPERPALRALAERLGILSAYVDNDGRTVPASDDTCVALLAAMGVDASSEHSASRALEELARSSRQRLVSPTRLVRATDLGTARIELMPAADLARGEWSVEMHEETGETRRGGGTYRTTTWRWPMRLPLPARPPPGVHRLRVTLRAGGRERQDEQTLIVVPSRCLTVTQRLGRRRVFGLWLNLYSLRSAANWGIGDLTDLRRLIDWSGEIGAAFVGLNPLHSVRNRGLAIAPYSPVSRLFRNVLYLDVSAIPDLAESPEAQRRLAAPALQAQLAELRRADRIDYDRIRTLKLAVCRILHQTFAARHRGRDSGRGRAYAAYLHEQGQALTDFATFCALDAHFAAERGHGSGWQTWPAGYRNPRSPAVDAFRAAHAEEVDFHCYLQFELDRQLAEAGRDASRCGLPIGLYQDLALGSSPDGSDSWAFPDAFVAGATLGAPPDAYSLLGQDWGLPPLHPHRLAADGYRYWIALLRAAFAHAGALRIDHAMGLFRQYWVPAGRPPTEGAYVRFPAEDLFGILALESRRAGALVVGEDLGTVPPELPPLLARWGVLSSRVLYFEQTKRQTFRAPSGYPARALVTANTHDMAPLLGYFEGRDLDLRRAVGAYPSEAEHAAAVAQRQRETEALVARLAAAGLLGRSRPLALVRRLARGRAAAAPRHAAIAAELRVAVHAFLALTPCALLGVSLDDLAGETEPVNLPGVGQDRYPSWSRRMRHSLESLRRDPAVRRLLAAVSARRLQRR